MDRGPRPLQRGRDPLGPGVQDQPELAMDMLARALDAGVPARWSTGDAVYGQYPGTRTPLPQETGDEITATPGLGPRRSLSPVPCGSLGQSAQSRFDQPRGPEECRHTRRHLLRTHGDQVDAGIEPQGSAS